MGNFNTIPSSETEARSPSIMVRAQVLLIAVLLASTLHAAFAQSGPVLPPSGGLPDNSLVYSPSVTSTMVVGQTYPATVRVRNVGSNTWSTNYRLSQVNTALNWQPSYVGMPMVVATGEQLSFEFDVIAPTTAGTHTMQWQMQNGTALFGAVASKQIVVQPSVVTGSISGASASEITGWACSTRILASIEVKVFAGGTVGVGTQIGTFLADQASNSTVASTCMTQGIAYAFRIPISNEMLNEHGGKSIHIYGLSPVGAGDVLLTNSGTYNLPTNAKPVVSITSPANGSVVNSPAGLVIQASASDSDGAIAGVTFYRNGQIIRTVTTAPYWTGADSLVSGTNTFYAIATDTRGGVKQSAAVNVNATQPPWTPPLIPPTGGIKRKYVYNEYQQLCKVLELESKATVIDYDNAGNVAWTATGLNLPSEAFCNLAEAIASGQRIVNTYDGRQRLISVVHPDGRGDQSNVYWPDGLLKQITTYNAPANLGQVVNTYAYNNRRLMTAESLLYGATTLSIGYGYDSLGNVANHVYPSGTVIDYSPNALGQPRKAGMIAGAVAYAPNGAVKQISYGNGVLRSVVQNSRQLPERVTDQFIGTPALDIGYAYDFAGNVTQITDHGTGRQNRTLSYDGLDRLTQAVSPMFGTASYTYSKVDNLTSLAVTGGNSPRNYGYIYDGDNRLANVTGGVGGPTVIGLGYDDRGNLINKNGIVYQFDSGNRLRQVVGQEVGYVYDGHGRRISSASGFNNPRYRNLMYSRDGQLMYSLDTGLSIRTEYVYLGGQLIGSTSQNYTIPGSSVSVKYTHADVLGSPIAFSNSAGAGTTANEFEPYGGVANRAGINGVGYTGHVEDASTGLVYMQQRYYDPSIGRFVSVDPVMAHASTGENFNRYWYANNNPYKFTDPDGRQVYTEEKGYGWQATPSNYFTDTFTGRLWSETLGDSIALFRSDNFNPLSKQYRSAGQLQDAKFNLLLAGSPVSRAEGMGANALNNLSFGRKLDFLFNRGVNQTVKYNADRAAGNASRLGIADTTANRAEVARRLNAAYLDPSSIVGPGKVPGSTVREAFIPGATSTGSKVQFVEKGGEIITIIAK